MSEDVTKDKKRYLPMHEAQRWFTDEEYEKIHDLMAKIGQGDKGAANEFLKKIDGWLKEQTNHIAKQVWGDAVDMALAQDGAQEQLTHMLVNLETRAIYFNDAADVWSRFSGAFQNGLRHRYQATLKQMNAEQADKDRLAAAASEIPAATVQGGSIERFRAEQVDAARDLIKPRKRIPIPQQALVRKQLPQLIDKALGVLDPISQDVLRRRADGETLEEVGTRYGYSTEGIRLLENSAFKTLRRADRRAADELRVHLDAYNIDHRGR